MRSIRNQRRFDNMKIERTVRIDREEYIVVISDESEALLAAKAAGRAVLGLLGASEEAAFRSMPAADYLVESLEDVEEIFLEQVVRRHLGLPWIIAETERLIIREFQEADAENVIREKTDTDADRIFYEVDTLKEYICCQYRFYEFGIWALVDKKSGALVGKAGLSCPEDGEFPVPLEEDGDDRVVLELGYHIFEPYRRQGYAVEACQAILAYAREQWENCLIYAKIDASNEASIGVAKACGFTSLNRAYNGALQYSYPCGPC